MPLSFSGCDDSEGGESRSFRIAELALEGTGVEGLKSDAVSKVTEGAISVD